MTGSTPNPLIASLVEEVTPAGANHTYVRNLLALSRATPALTVMVFNDRAPASTRRRSGR